MLDQQVEQDAIDLATETLMDFLADREKKQEQLAMDAAGRVKFKGDLAEPGNSY